MAIDYRQKFKEKLEKNKNSKAKKAFKDDYLGRKQKIKVQQNSVSLVEENLNNYKSNKPRAKQVNPNFNNNSGNLNSKAKKAFKNDYLGRNQKKVTKTDKVVPTTHTSDLNYSVKTKSFATDTPVLDLKMINGATKTKSFAARKRELEKDFLGRLSFEELVTLDANNDPSLKKDSVARLEHSYLKKDQKVKVDDYLEIRKKRSAQIPAENKSSQKITTKPYKVDPTTHTLDLNYSVDGAGTRVNSRGKLGGGRKAGNNIKSRTKAGVGTGVETGNRLLPPASNTGTVNAATKKPAAAAAPKAGKQKHIYTVFDFETNGKIKGNGVDKVMPEVLSYSAQKYELDLLTGESVLKGSMEGYYQPKDGNFNGGAQRVHGLDEAKINAARTDKNYGATFEDDKAKLIEFMNKDSDAIVAHNIDEFDGHYFVGELDETITKVDTYTEAKNAMLETDVLQYSEAKNGDIHTKTNSSVYHYYENKMPEGELHNAANDVKITAENYHNMVLDEQTGLADNLGLDKTKVKEFKRAKSDHYYRVTVGKDGEKITTKMSAETNKPLTVEGEVDKVLKAKEKTAAGVTRKDIAENAKAATRKFGDTMREFGTAAKKFGDDFSKLSTGKKAGRIAGAAAVIGGGTLLVKTAKDRRKAEQEKLKSITASVEKNRSGGF